MREHLHVGELFITMDFGVHQAQWSEGGSGQLPDLVLVLHFLDSEGDLVCCYVDCLPLVDQPESKDWNYVTSTFDELFASGFFAPFSKIICRSDTGPSHFRTSNTLYYWRKFHDRTNITVELYFFAPYHGHSMCDGHIGTTSRAITFAGNKLNRDLVRWNRSWVESQIACLKMTSIPIERTAKEVLTVTGVRNYLVFLFNRDAPGTVTCGRMCGDLQPDCKEFARLSPAVVAADQAAATAEHRDLSTMARQPAEPQLAIFTL
jgi:hypothetical protein